jgi:hypothetical protein
VQGRGRSKLLYDNGFTTEKCWPDLGGIWGGVGGGEGARRKRCQNKGRYKGGTPNTTVPGALPEESC